MSKPYQPKTGAKCSCKRGQQRDNCPNCEGTGQVIDFVAIRAAVKASMEAKRRLEYLRRQLRAECMSWNELGELQSLAEYIAPGDVELLEAAGVKENSKCDS
jgi:hypothetical protein